MPTSQPEECISWGKQSTTSAFAHRIQASWYATDHLQAQRGRHTI